MCFCVRAGWLLQSVDRIPWYVPYFPVPYFPMNQGTGVAPHGSGPTALIQKVTGADRSRSVATAMRTDGASEVTRESRPRQD